MSILGVVVAAALMPMPRSVEMRGGSVAATGEVRIVESRDAAIAAEGYRIEIDGSGVKVFASDAAGFFRARTTLGQLAEDGRWPCCRIEDAPTFQWRGLMLDEGRHFFGKETVKALLDQMAEYKLNVFHWHLTEDQGWRLAIDRFPELVEYGAVRPESPAHGCIGAPWDYRGNGVRYGPYFYTAADVREILAYAKERFISVVPEVEMPGHIRRLGRGARRRPGCGDGRPLLARGEVRHRGG